MKRLPSLLLSLVLSLALLVPLFLRRTPVRKSATPPLPAARKCTSRSIIAATATKPSASKARTHAPSAIWTRLRRSSRSKAPWMVRRALSRFPFHLLRDPNHPLITNLSLRAPNRPLTDLSRGIPHSYFPKAAVKGCRFFAPFLRIFLLQFVFNCCILSTVNSK